MPSAVNEAGMTIAVGCIVSAVLIRIIATFVIALVQSFERYTLSDLQLHFLSIVDEL